MFLVLDGPITNFIDGFDEALEVGVYNEGDPMHFLVLFKERVLVELFRVHVMLMVMVFLDFLAF